MNKSNYRPITPPVSVVVWCKMAPIGSCVEHLVFRWWQCFGKLCSLGKTGPSWRKWVIALCGSGDQVYSWDLLPVSSLVPDPPRFKQTPAFCLPSHNGLHSFKLLAKLNVSIFSLRQILYHTMGQMTNALCSQAWTLELELSPSHQASAKLNYTMCG